MTLSNPEHHTLAVWNLSKSHTSRNVARINDDIFINLEAYVICNFNCCIKTEGVLKVTESHHHVHCKSATISKTVQIIDVITDH